MAEINKLWGLLLLCNDEQCPLKEHLLQPIAFDIRAVANLQKMAKEVAIAENRIVNVVEFTRTKIVEQVNGGH